MTRRIETPTIGEILREEFMEPMGITSYRLANDIGVPVSRIQDIVHDRRKITVDTSLRLGKYFGVSDRYFLNMQNDIDIRNEKALIEEELNKIVAINQIDMFVPRGGRATFVTDSLTGILHSNVNGMKKKG